MPITRKQFELGIDSAILEWMKKVHDFLAARKEQAFAETELAEELIAWTPEQMKLKRMGMHLHLTDDFTLALDKLVEVGAVEERVVKGTAYFSYRGALEL